MDGLFHAERSGNLIDAAQCTVEFWCVFDATSPLRGESGDNHRGHYGLTGLDLPVTALVAIAVAGVLTCLVLLLVSRADKASKGGSARDMITRFMGLIVLSMGVQFALTGLRKFGT